MTQDAQEQTADLDKVISRIQKILSMSTTASGTTEAEADTALKMAQELAMKYNLDLAAIEASAAQSNNPQAAAERVKDELKGKAMYTWQRDLAKYVAEANFCYHLIQERSEWISAHYKLMPIEVKRMGKSVKDFKPVIPNAEYWDMDHNQRHHVNTFYMHVDGRYKKSHKHIFVGRKSNVVTAQLMFQYLTQTIEDLVLDELGLTNAQRLSRSAMSWKAGVADRLCERLSSRRADLIAKHDARVKQEEADRQAAAKKAREEHAAKQTRGLPAHHESEVKAAFEGISGDAYDLTGPNEAEDTERPDIDDEEEPWTPEGEEVPEPEVGSALVLASVYDKNEQEANYELAHGLEPGQLAKWRAEREEERRKEAEAEAEEQQDEVEAPVKAETEKQRKARMARQAKEYAANRRRWAREDETARRKAQREWEKRDHRAYNKGVKKADSIGLDLQVKAGKDVKKLS